MTCTIAGLFPGQGGIAVGDAKVILEASEYTRFLFEKASQYCNTDLVELSTHGPEKTLLLSRTVQPVIVALSLGLLYEFRAHKGELSVVVGHSLGEISALAASGVISDDKALVYAIERGIRMDEAASTCGGGGMRAVVFTPLENVRNLIAELFETYPIYLANVNAPEHCVVSGTHESLAVFAKLLKERGLGKCQPVRVRGPWHTPLMIQARQSYARWVEHETFAAPRIPLILNENGSVLTDAHEIKQSHINQLVNPVQWQACMTTLIELNPLMLVEFGPGRMLTGLARVNGFKRGSVVVSGATVSSIIVALNNT